MRITAVDVRFSHDRTASLFSDFNVELRPRLLYGLVGSSGSGKSTLLSLLAGFRQPSAGEVIREGVDRVGWVLQNPVGSPRRTALDLVAQPLLYHGASREHAEQEARQLLTAFKLDNVADREFRLLSGGEAQRLAFARAAASNVDALLLDEPTAQLDPSTAESVRHVIRQLVSDDRIVVLATHDQALSAACDVVIDLGAYRAVA